jgi:FkbM family methyltransferase
MGVDIENAIEEMLQEGIAGAVDRERNAFDAVADGLGKRLVLFGAGNLGRKTLAGLRLVGLEPLAFADNNPELWSRVVDGLSVLSPERAAREYGKDAVFLITIWRGEASDRMAERESQLRALGCKRVLSFGPLFWKYSTIFLPHYAVDLPENVHRQRDQVLSVARLWADEDSRREYLAQLRWRLLFDFDGLPDPVQHQIYFPLDLCPVSSDETFVDCGAYDGDTVDSFIALTSGDFRQIVAFEPDPTNFEKLQRRISENRIRRPHIAIRNAAVGAERGRVHFTATGNESSFVGTGTLEVDCVTLDDALRDVTPTYIKMDIEGSELDALAGASQTITRHTPVLAICAYHRQDHLWRIPLLIHQMSDRYAFFLRPHLVEVWDLVCYAVPVDRLRVPRGDRA